MIALIAVRKWLSLVPSWVYAGAALFLFGYFLAFTRQAKKFEQYKADQAEVVQQWKTKAETISTQTVIQYVDRIQVVRERGQSIEQKVPAYVPRNACVLPDGFRRVLDAAATGSDLPDPSRESDETPTASPGSSGVPSSLY